MKQKNFLSKINNNTFTGIEDIGRFTFNNVLYYSRNENE